MVTQNSQESFPSTEKGKHNWNKFKIVLHLKNLDCSQADMEQQHSNSYFCADPKRQTREVSSRFYYTMLENKGLEKILSCFSAYTQAESLEKEAISNVYRARVGELLDSSIQS